jgi:hypothetical protein
LEGLLERVRSTALREALQCGDLPTHDRRDGAVAREDGIPVDEHHAGPALLQPAPVMSALEVELVAQDVEEWRIRVGLNPDVLPVDVEFEIFGHLCR